MALLVNDITPRKQYTATGGQTAFAYTFAIFEESDLKVYLTPVGNTADDAADILVLTTDYSVTGEGTTSGGDVTLVVAATAGDIVTIVRDIPVERTSDYQTNGDLQSTSLNNDLDKLVMMVQQQEESIDGRLLKFIETANLAGVDPSVPAPEALKVIRWNAAATALENTDDPSVSAAAASASAAAALVSENNAETAETNAETAETNAAASEAAAGISETNAAASETAAALSAAISANANLYSESLTKLIHPDQSKGLQELQKQGVYPSSFNQQNGGMGYGGLPNYNDGESASSSVMVSGHSKVGDTASRTYAANGCMVSQDTDIASIYINIVKGGNPTNNLTLEIWDDSGSQPNAVITNGAATAISGELMSPNPLWVKYTFPTAPTLTANTQYYIVLKSSGAVDASHNWDWYYGDATSYAHGNRWTADGTPTWTEDTSNSHNFIIEPATTILNAGLTGFDGSLHHHEGAPLNQSGGFYFASNELNHKRGMIHLAGTGWNKDKTFYDSGVSPDNSRIVIRCNVTTGYAQVDLYENDETKHTVTGTTDISTGNHIVSVGYRSEGDGSDYLKLYVDGVSEGTELTSQTITLDRRFIDGYTMVGGGFPLAPTWTNSQDMTALPSTDGWTFNSTTVTEANAFIINNGIMYGNTEAHAAVDTSYYDKTTTLNNATGWAVSAGIRVLESNNDTQTSENVISIKDGTKRIDIEIYKTFIDVWSASYLKPIQIDMFKMRDILITGKGSDFFIYIDNVLVFDGSNLLTSSTATNSITFGDIASSSEVGQMNEWHHFKYYEGEYLPEYSTMQLSELADWNDDKSSLLSTIYNSGTIQSVKTLAGMNENYVKPVKQVITAKGITSNPTTTSTGLNAVLPDMNLFSFGSYISAMLSGTFQQSNDQVVINIMPAIDGRLDGLRVSGGVSAINGKVGLTSNRKEFVFSGLHYINANWGTDSNTATANSTQRILTVEAE